MTRLFVKLAIAATVGSLIPSHPTVAQTLPSAKKAPNVEITQGPVLELAIDDFAIIRWTTTNPGGSDEHFGVVHYGTSPQGLSQVAKSHIRLNRSHPETIFRVRVNGLTPQTTYYYTVTSMGSSGESDGVERSRQPVHHTRRRGANRGQPSAKVTTTTIDGGLERASSFT